MEIKHTNDLTTSIYQDALQIRKDVFIEEQGVTEALEIEGEDGCLHFVLYHLKLPVATCRFYIQNSQSVKLQRMAVLKEYRNLKLGKKLMSEAEKTAKEKGFIFVTLGAQNSAIGFYEKLGYTTYGEEFLDAGIAHHMMKKSL